MTAVVLAPPGELADALLDRLGQVARTSDGDVTHLDGAVDAVVLVVDDAAQDDLGALTARLEHLAQHLGARGGGRLVLVGSSTALLGLTGLTRAATTAALLGLVRALTHEHAANGVVCSLVLNGAADGDEDAQARLAARTVLAGGADTAAVADAVAFLASPEASYCHGLVLPVDGGASIGRT